MAPDGTGPFDHVLLRLMSVPDKSGPVRIERATVLWVKDCEFAIEAREMTPADRAWVDEFLYCKLGLPWISDGADNKKPFQTIESERQVDADVAGTLSGHSRAIMRMLVVNQILTQEIEDKVIQRCIAQLGCGQEDACAGYRQFIQEVWHPALGIVSGMTANRVHRELTGQNSIANN